MNRLVLVIPVAALAVAACGSHSSSTTAPVKPSASHSATPAPSHSVVTPPASHTPVTVRTTAKPPVAHRSSAPPVVVASQAAPAPVKPAAPTATAQAAPPPVGCTPHTSGGNCYKAGEFCPAADHGISGIAGNGAAITCRDNGGTWRWEG